MKKTVLALTLAITSVFVQAADITESQSDREWLLQKFVDVKPLETLNDSSYAPKCQKLSDEALELGYRTRITDFNAKTGVTSCEIHNSNDRPTSFSANTLNTAITEKTNVKISEDEIESLREQHTRNDETTIRYIPQTGDYLTLSRFISAMMTLDPEIIDFESTNVTGIVKFKGSYSLLAINQRNGTAGENEKISSSIADKFNKANLAYYSNLFSNMSEVYQYLQNLLFVFIGMFFIGKVGFDKGARALDKSKDTGDTQWLARFYIPVLTVGFFFAPIPEDNNMSATIVQKTIRFMVAESNAIADKASAIGVNTYMQKLYSTVGAMNAAGEAEIKNIQKSADAQIPIYRAAIQDNGVCKIRFKGVTSFVGIEFENIETRRAYEDQDPNHVSENASMQDITFNACRTIEYRMMVQIEANKTNSAYIAGIENAYKGGGDNDLQKMLARINTSFQAQQDQLGWTNAIIIPSASILIESLATIKNASIVSGNTTNLDENIMATMNFKKLENLSGQINDARQREDNQSDMGELIGKFAYMTLPGARGIYETLGKHREEAVILARDLRSASGITNQKIDEQLKITADKVDDRTYLIATSSIYEWMITKMPIIVSVIAGIIAFIGYVVELAKYFYISPFVVAFALTTKKTHKIVDFMVTGLTVFFKPILLVIFIFFSLFIYSLAQDIFLNYAVNQFNVLKYMATGSELTEGILSLLSAMLQIFGSLGATYIMWKLILTGPTWAMKLVGVDNAQNDMLSDALSQRMDRAGFKM